MPHPDPSRADDAWVPRDVKPPTGRADNMLGRAVQRANARLAGVFGRRQTDRKLRLPLLIPPAALVLCCWLLARQITPETITELQQAIATTTLQQWLAACVFTALSYIAIGRNEGVAHAFIGSGIRLPRARRAGRAAVAIAQAVGFGTVTAAVARKRMLPEMDLWTLARVSITASLAFLAALAGLAIGAALYLRTGAPWLSFSALCTCFVLARILRPLVGLPGLSRARAAHLLAWTTLDVAFAAMALWVFLPAGHAISPATLISAYIIALGFGLLSQSPGGLGAFEIALILLLPQIPAGQLLAAIFAYRITYHLAPALVALPSLLQNHGPPMPTPLLPVEGKAAERAMQRAAQGDWGLVHQGAQIRLTRDQSAGWLTRTTTTSLVAIGRPLGSASLHDLAATASAHGVLPLLYKCDARTATQARRAGWAVSLLSQEAVLHPASWSSEGSSKRQLRRKLRTATKAGLRIECCPQEPPWDDLRLIHAAWNRERGPERGFSMGRFSTDLIAHQLLFVGYVDQQPVAFVTFHHAGAEWGLDLMRLTSAAPSGTMQSLITAAIAHARQSGTRRISLAACLHPDVHLPNWIPKEDGHQFKSAFGPSWQSLYVAAPDQMSLLIGLANVTQSIHFPPPVSDRTSRRARWRRPGKKPFELSPAACDAPGPDSLSAAVISTPDAAPPTRSESNDKRPDNPA